jgi:hypothetical protein
VRYWIRRRGGYFPILRNGRVIEDCGGDQACARVGSERVREGRGRLEAGHRSGDVGALCQLGWHRLALRSGPASLGDHGVELPTRLRP